MAVIFIPDQQYEKITVNGNGAGVSLPPWDSDLHVTSSNSAMSVCVSKGFNKTIDVTNTGSSGSLILSASADDYTLQIKGKDSAISVAPELPNYTLQQDYIYVKGDGEAAINLNLTNSAFSVTVEDLEEEIMDSHWQQ